MHLSASSKRSILLLCARYIHDIHIYLKEMKAQQETSERKTNETRLLKSIINTPTQSEQSDCQTAILKSQKGKKSTANDKCIDESDECKRKIVAFNRLNFSCDFFSVFFSSCAVYAVVFVYIEATQYGNILSRTDRIQKCLSVLKHTTKHQLNAIGVQAGISCSTSQ